MSRAAHTFSQMLLVIACLGGAAFAGGVDSQCRWRVVRVRPPVLSDVPFAEASARLAEPPDVNNVPGPDSTRLEVRKDSDRKPSLYLVDPRSGGSELLLARASAPRPSPDGRLVAAIRWESIKRPWTLTVIDVRTKRQIGLKLDGCASPYAWSPNGKWLAVMVTPCQAPKSRLAVVAVPSGRTYWIDSLAVFSDYEFSWSPDSRHLAVVRPTAIEPHTEEPSAADVWVFAVNDWRRCLLARTPEYVEHNPQWISSTALLVERLRKKNGTFAGEDRVVLELREE